VINIHIRSFPKRKKMNCRLFCIKDK